jgi:ribose transport system permease protein
MEKVNQSHVMPQFSTRALTFLINNSTLVVFILMLVIAGILSDKFTAATTSLTYCVRAYR